MSEHHVVAGPARGEPLSEGEAGARIRVPLSGTPSSDWSLRFRAALTAGLQGHGGASQLKLNRIVQGGELVIEGVTDAEAPALGEAVRAAVAAANAGMARAERPPRPCNMPQDRADGIAEALGLEHERVPRLEVHAYEPRKRA
jgi:hypothetical protein